MLQHVTLAKQVADRLTKGLRKDKHLAFIRQLNMQTDREFRALGTSG